jgi:hypothetical protein
MRPAERILVGAEIDDAIAAGRVRRSTYGTPGMAALEVTLRPPAARITWASAHKRAAGKQTLDSPR